MALGQVDDVELVREAGAEVDLVVVSGPGAGADWPPVPLGSWPSGVRLVALDPGANQLRVRTSQHGVTTEWIVEGRMARLVEMVKGWASEVAGAAPCHRP